MIKSELIEKIAQDNNLSKTDAKRVIETIFNELRQALVNGNRVELREFGVLSVRQRKARKGRNPKTGTTVNVAAKRVPFFKAGKSVIEALNSGNK